MPSLASILAGVGDPETDAAAAGSNAMAPVVEPYLRDVLSGKYAFQGLRDVNNAFKSHDLAALAGTFGPAPLGIRAFHGSPHDFNAFDASKIGTGEGAQAYGHGLYFAENPETAQQYADRLARTQVGTAVSTPSSAVPTGVAETAASYVRDARRDGAFAPNNPAAGWDAAINRARDFSRDPAVVDLLERWKQENAPISTQKHMYEVNINAEPHQFLDWDKPLSEQSDAVRGALQTAGWDVGRAGSLTGEGIVRQYEHAAAPSYGSGKLQQAGIPGIRYLDQGSRGTGQGTSNYVVFDPALVEILKKYGLAGLLAGGAASGGDQQ